jgi:hypothetical protein
MTSHLYFWEANIRCELKGSSEDGCKDDSLELVERRLVLFDFGPEHGAFPGVHEESRNVHRRQARPNATRLLGLAHA